MDQLNILWGGRFYLIVLTEESRIWTTPVNIRGKHGNIFFYFLTLLEVAQNYLTYFGKGADDFLKPSFSKITIHLWRQGWRISYIRREDLCDSNEKYCEVTLGDWSWYRVSLISANNNPEQSVDDGELQRKECNWHSLREGLKKNYWNFPIGSLTHQPTPLDGQFFKKHLFFS